MYCIHTEIVLFLEKRVLFLEKKVPECLSTYLKFIITDLPAVWKRCWYTIPVHTVTKCTADSHREAQLCQVRTQSALARHSAFWLVVDCRQQTHYSWACNQLDSTLPYSAAFPVVQLCHQTSEQHITSC